MVEGVTRLEEDRSKNDFLQYGHLIQRRERMESNRK